MFLNNDVFKISIHAAREGGDAVDWNTIKGVVISIHAAREGGDMAGRKKRIEQLISIHAAREGGDQVSYKSGTIIDHFNPRRP